MNRYLALTYGLISYAIFFATFLATIGFAGNFGVPKSIDSPATGPLITALLVDLGLIGLFAMQLSLMARPWFQERLTRSLPAALERSTCVLASSAALSLLFWQWRPLDGMLWSVAAPSARALIYVLFASGWLTILASTFLLNHFDLFGLRQVWLYFRGQEYTPAASKIPGPHGWFRHRLYVGCLLTVWATPTMSMAHLLLALGMTGFIVASMSSSDQGPWEDHGALRSFGLPARGTVPLER